MPSFSQRQRVDRLELEVQHAGGGVGLFQRRSGLGEGIVDAVVVDHGGAALGVADQLGGFVLQVLLGNAGGEVVLPGHLDLFGGAHRGVGGVGEHHHPARHRVGGIVQGDAAQVALDRLGGRIVDRHHLGAVAGRRDLRAARRPCPRPRHRCRRSRCRWSCPGCRSPGCRRRSGAARPGGLIGMVLSSSAEKLRVRLPRLHDLRIADRAAAARAPRCRARCRPRRPRRAAWRLPRSSRCARRRRPGSAGRSSATPTSCRR